MPPLDRVAAHACCSGRRVSAAVGLMVVLHDYLWDTSRFSVDLRLVCGLGIHGNTFQSVSSPLCHDAGTFADGSLPIVAYCCPCCLRCLWQQR